MRYNLLDGRQGREEEPNKKGGNMMPLQADAQGRIKGGQKGHRPRAPNSETLIIYDAIEKQFFCYN